MKILVTGGSKGIGKSIAEELKSIGDVYAVARNEELLKQLDISGYFVCDLSKDVEKLCSYIKDMKFDVIVNNAGEYIYGGIDTMTPEQIEHIYDTNLLAPVRIISAGVTYMKEHKFGRIVNIGSISGVMGEAYASLYSSTKSGLIGLTKALALELAEYNITVNTINPGWVDTELGNDSIEESEFSKEEIIECIPQRRFVKPEEVAKLVKYLISEEAKGITGQSINLCAGLSVGI
ncbi:MAG: SDR family oxidoreductase [Candidatus Gastranaerophilales bacterium]|nr:SDR family oxidoreductase [Candidatus Gastranaerophilales bacterium]